MIRKILLVLVAVLVLIQFIRPGKNQGNTSSADDITTLYEVPGNVQVILKKACYDCHSNYTIYPWYFNIQPVAWWMNHHIEEGKEELNFSEFGKRKPESRVKKLKKVAHEVEEGEMPMDSYTWIHKDAKLTDDEKATIMSWAKALSEQIAAQGK